MMEFANSKDTLQESHGLEAGSMDVSLLSLLNNQQQRAFMNLVSEDDPDTKQKVIAHNLGVVVNIARRYSDHGVALLDLVREGNQGLIHALDSFELQDGFRFAAYAARCVRQSIECTIMNQIEPE